MCVTKLKQKTITRCQLATHLYSILRQLCLLCQCFACIDIRIVSLIERFLEFLYLKTGENGTTATVDFNVRVCVGLITSVGYVIVVVVVVVIIKCVHV